MGRGWRKAAATVTLFAATVAGSLGFSVKTAPAAEAAQASASAKAYSWPYRWCAKFNPGWVCP